MTPPVSPAQLLSFPERAESRLRLALWRLDAALSAQRKAIAGLRAELTSLGDALAGVESSLQSYRGALGEAAAGLDRAALEARRLERTAEIMQGLRHA